MFFASNTYQIIKTPFCYTPFKRYFNLALIKMTIAREHKCTSQTQFVVIKIPLMSKPDLKLEESVISQYM